MKAEPKPISKNNDKFINQYDLGLGPTLAGQIPVEMLEDGSPLYENIKLDRKERVNLRPSINVKKWGFKQKLVNKWRLAITRFYCWCVPEYLRLYLIN